MGHAKSDDLDRWEMVGPVQIDLREHTVPTDAAWRAGGLTAGARIRSQILADPYVLPEPIDGTFMSLPYPVTYETDGSLTLGAPRTGTGP